MSRTKEGFERESDQPGMERSGLGRQDEGRPDKDWGRGSSSYYSGRESWQEFPRKSTSVRQRGLDADREQRSNRYGRSEKWDRANRDYSSEPTRQRYESNLADEQLWPHERYGRGQSRTDYPARGENRFRTEYRPERRPPYDREEFDEGYRDDRGRDVFHWNREREENPYYANQELYGTGWGFPGYATGYPASGTYGRGPVRCRDIMTRDVTTCSPTESIREVAKRMEDENVGSLPIVEEGRLVGIITDRDIVCRVLADDIDTRSTSAAEAGSKDLVTATPEEPITEALHKMSEYQIRRIPIIDLRGRLVGMVSLGDIALEAEHDHELVRGLQEISRPLSSGGRRR